MKYLHVFTSRTETVRFPRVRYSSQPASTRDWPGGRLLHIHEQRGLPTPHIRRHQARAHKTRAPRRGKFILSFTCSHFRNIFPALSYLDIAAAIWVFSSNEMLLGAGRARPVIICPSLAWWSPPPTWPLDCGWGRCDCDCVGSISQPAKPALPSTGPPAPQSGPEPPGLTWLHSPA